MKKNIIVLIVIIIAIIIIYVAYRNSRDNINSGTNLVNLNQSANTNINHEGTFLENGQINTDDLEVTDLEETLSEKDELKSDLQNPDINLDVSFE